MTDCTQTKKTDRHEDNWTQKQKKNLKKWWSPRYRVSILSTKCRGCHPKGLIVASLYKIIIIIIIMIMIIIIIKIMIKINIEEVVIAMENAEVVKRGRKDKLPAALRNKPKKKL